MLFKIETVVQVVIRSVFVSSVLLSISTHGQTRNSEETGAGEGVKHCRETYGPDVKEAKEALKAAKKKPTSASYTDTQKDSDVKTAEDAMATAEAQYDNCLVKNRGSTSTNAQSCAESEKGFEDAAGAFEGACGAAGLPKKDNDPTNDYKSGAIGCSWSIGRCACTETKPSSEIVDRFECNEKSSARSNLKPTIQGIGLIDLANAQKRTQFCPHEDPDDTERYEKQLEKSQERVKDLKKKMPELLNKGTEAQDKAEQAQNDATKKAADAQKEFANEMKEIKRKKEADEQQAVTELTSAREKMDQLDAQIRQLELSKLDAEMGLSKTKTEIELNCHTQATNQVAARQVQKMSSIKKGQPQGDFNQLMNSVGVSSRAAWEKVAEVYYKRCLNSRPTRESKAAAQNIYNSTIRQVDNTIATTRKQRQSMEENLKQIMSTNGCGSVAPQANGMTNESRMCRSIRQAQEDAQQAYQNQLQQQQVIQKEMISAQKQLATKNQALGTEYQDAQRELAEEQARMENLRAYLNMRREKKQGSGTKKASEELTPAQGKLNAAARTFDRCCHTEKWEQRESCNTVMNYLKHIEVTSQQGTTPFNKDKKPAEVVSARPGTDSIQANPQSAPAGGVREGAPNRPGN